MLDRKGKQRRGIPMAEAHSGTHPFPLRLEVRMRETLISSSYTQIQVYLYWLDRGAMVTLHLGFEALHQHGYRYLGVLETRSELGQKNEVRRALRTENINWKRHPNGKLMVKGHCPEKERFYREECKRLGQQGQLHVSRK